MDSLTYNYQLCIDPILEALLVRCSYLIADRTFMTGSTRQQYFLFKDTKRPFEEKLHFLETVTTGNELADLKIAVQEIRKFNKIKHPNKVQIVAFQRFKKVLNEIHDEEVRKYTQTLDSLGFMQMDQVAQYGYFDWYHLDLDVIRMPGQKHAFIKNMMELLPNKTADCHTSFCLPSSLFKNIPIFEQALTHDITVSQHLPGLSFLHPCFQFPNLLLLSPNELHSIKTQVQPLTELFHSKTNQWMTICKSSNTPAASLSFFKEEVLPLSQRLQKELDQNKLLFQYRLSGNDKQNVTVFLGELSMAAVWQLYYDANAIPDEDWKELLAIKDEPQFNRPLPVLIMHVLTTVGDSPVTGSPTLKKSINID